MLQRKKIERDKRERKTQIREIKDVEREKISKQIKTSSERETKIRDKAP